MIYNEIKKDTKREDVKRMQDKCCVKKLKFFIYPFDKRSNFWWPIGLNWSRLTSKNIVSKVVACLNKFWDLT